MAAIDADAAWVEGEDQLRLGAKGEMLAIANNFGLGDPIVWHTFARVRGPFIRINESLEATVPGFTVRRSSRSLSGWETSQDRSS